MIRTSQENTLYGILHSYANADDLDGFGQALIVSAEEDWQRREELSGWLNTRCAGPLGVQGRDSALLSFANWRSAPDCNRIYIHRTALAYLERPDVWTAIVTHKLRKNFSSHLAWLKAWIFFLETLFSEAR